MVIGGDWKQQMPVILGGTMLSQFDASVKNSHLFKHFVTRRLRTNHRLRPDQAAYRRMLLRIATAADNDQNDRVQLPAEMCVSACADLLDFVFPKELLEKPLDHWQELSGRAILCPLNRETFDMNNVIMVIVLIIIPSLSLFRIELMAMSTPLKQLHNQ